MDYLTLYFNALWQLSLEAAPWLLLGLLIGGLFKSLLPTAFLQRHLTGSGFSAITKAALLGIPLPLCSCGVIPAALGLRKAGASRSATTSFLVSTPETGIDSISIGYAMMGPFMAIIRPIAALFSALVSGLLVMFFGEKDEPIKNQVEPTKLSCCAAKVKQQAPISRRQAVFDGVHYAFSDLLQSILKWLVIGLMFAALVDAFVPQDWLLKWGDGWLTMLLMMLIGIPMYVCATGSTPIAAGFLAAGISPGAVLVYLLAGPATNMATLGVVREHLGRRSMWLYLLGIMSSALCFGFLVNELSDFFQVKSQVAGSHAMLPYGLQLGSLLLLFVVAVFPLLQKKFTKASTGSEPVSCCGSQQDKEPSTSSCCDSQTSPTATTKASSCCSTKKHS